MSKGYRLVMKGCGALAVAVGLVYAVMLTVALGDGMHSGIEIPSEINVACPIVLVVAGVASGCAWIVDRSAQDSAIHYLKPLIRAEIDRGIAEAIPAAAEIIGAELAVQLESKIREALCAQTARSRAALREVVTGDVMKDMLDAAVGRAHRAGMLHQAQAAVGRVPGMRLARVNTDEN